MAASQELMAYTAMGSRPDVIDPGFADRSADHVGDPVDEHDGYKQLLTLDDQATVEAICAVLDSRGISVTVRAREPGFEISVPEDVFHRASVVVWQVRASRTKGARGNTSRSQQRRHVAHMSNRGTTIWLSTSNTGSGTQLKALWAKTPAESGAVSVVEISQSSQNFSGTVYSAIGCRPAEPLVTTRPLRSACMASQWLLGRS